MKPTLRIITEHRSRQLRSRRRGVPRRPVPTDATQGAPELKDSATTTSQTPPSDPAMLRVRAAGGPVDEASYTCQCGYVFAASVSTTVTCPHCGTGQAW
ncbi:MAG TPA: hypothetical protein VID48_15260 [Solirubrobacteraceae bacterium]|jgi:hypothetical protein